jgi:alkylation response protein AidB-like acyl-CoA dehydrogenase
LPIDPDPRALARGLRELIESEASAIEAASTLTQPVVDALCDTGLFGLLMPREFGGMEENPSGILDVCEELSFADGSTGWAFAQNTTVMAYSAYLSPDCGKQLAAARSAAGMFAPLGSANKVEGGFQVSGQYKFGSGSGHAEYMGGAALEMHDGAMPEFEDGLPLIRAYIVPRSGTVFHGNWDVMGLRGTGSYDYEVLDQFAPEGMTFSLFASEGVTGGPLYGLGPVPLGTISSCAWAIGVANRALHEIVEIVSGDAGRTRMGAVPMRDQQIFQRDLGTHRMALDAARLLAHDAYGEAVEAVRRGDAREECALIMRRTWSAASYATKVAKAATVFAYEVAGSQSMRNPSLLQRCFRDMYVGSAHLVFDDRNYSELAKIMLGMEPSRF